MLLELAASSQGEGLGLVPADVAASGNLTGGDGSIRILQAPQYPSRQGGYGGIYTPGYVNSG